MTCVIGKPSLLVLKFEKNCEKEKNSNLKYFDSKITIMKIKNNTTINNKRALRLYYDHQRIEGVMELARHAIDVEKLVILILNIFFYSFIYFVFFLFF